MGLTASPTHSETRGGDMQVRTSIGSWTGAVANFGRSSIYPIPGGRSFCWAACFRDAEARQQPRPPKSTVIGDDTRRGLRSLPGLSPHAVGFDVI